MAFNLELIAADRALLTIAGTIESRVDESGKAISSTKAKVLTDATVEAAEVNEIKTHLANIRALMNALELLQHGIMDVSSKLRTTGGVN